VSTVFTLILVPALFSLTMELRTWLVGLIFGTPAVEPAPASVSTAALKETLPDTLPEPSLPHAQSVYPR